MTESAAVMTEEQEEFLKMCEAKFKNRFTEEDEDFMAVHSKNISDPPIVSPWHGFRSRRNRRNDQDDRSGRFGGHSRDHSGNRDRNYYRDREDNTTDRDRHRHFDDRQRSHNSHRHDNRRYDDQRYQRDRRNW